MTAPNEAQAREQYLGFSVGGSDYAVGILRVREILQYETLTPVPSTPRWIRGVINLRGSVVPVVDLAVKFGLADTPLTKWTCILIVEVAIEGERTRMGIMADSVSEVIELGAADVEPPPSFGTAVRPGFLLGMGKLERRFVLLIDLDRVIAASERELTAAVESAGDAAPPPPDGAPATSTPPAQA